MRPLEGRVYNLCCSTIKKKTSRFRQLELNNTLKGDRISHLKPPSPRSYLVFIFKRVHELHVRCTFHARNSSKRPVVHTNRTTNDPSTHIIGKSDSKGNGVISAAVTSLDRLSVKSCLRDADVGISYSLYARRQTSTRSYKFLSEQS